MKFTTFVIFLVGAIAYGQRSDFDAISFDKADSIAMQNKGASLQNLPVLVHNLTSNLHTEVEKFRSIYTWVCTNVENDYGSYQRTVKKRRKLSSNPEALAKWNNDYIPKVFKNLVKYRKTACTGYAFLVREMAMMADIKCTIINGYGRTPTLILDKKSIPNHSWNAVKLDHKWYLCDATWSAGKIVLEDGVPRFKPDYFDDYFLADPEFFIRNHYPLEIDLSFLNEPTTFEQFIEGPVVYKEAFSNAIIPVSPSKMMLSIIKQDTVRISLKVPSGFKTDLLSLLLVHNGNQIDVKPEISVENDFITLSHVFEKAGVFDVHITYKNEIVSTYVVKSKRN